MPAAEAGAAPKTRVTKDPDVRREELLDVALDLCRTQGFEALRVEQIVQRAGVAKGTFYHYFASKDAVLEALVQRFGDGLFAHLSGAAQGPGSAAQRLSAVMHAAREFKVSFGDLSLASLLMAEDALPMRHRVYRVWREQSRQVLRPLVASGVADRSFDVVSVDGAIDIVVLLWFDAADQLWERSLTAATAEEFVDAMLNGAAAISQAQERVLGVAPGTYSAAITPEIIDFTKELFHTIKGKQS